MFKKYIWVRQDDLKDCGVASLLTIIKTYRGNISKEALRILSKTTRDGTSAYDLMVAAKKMGFAVKGIKGNIKDLQQENILLPCIAHVIINNSYKHYIVIHKINKKKKTLIIADPSTGIKKYTFNEFAKIWTGVLIILYPIKRIPVLKNIKTLKTFLYELLITYQQELLIIFIFSIFMTILNIGNSFYLKILIDNMIITKSLHNLYLIFILFIFIIIIKCLTDLFRKNILIYLNRHIDTTVFNDIFKHLMVLPYSYYKTRTTGEIINRINDLNHIKEFISRIVLGIFIDIILIIIVGIVLFFINQTLFIISIILAIIYIGISIFYNPILDKYINEIKQQEAKVSSYLVESINSFETIKGLNINDNITNNLSFKYDEYLYNYYHFNYLCNIQSFLKDFLNQFSIAIILLIGSIQVINQEMTLGTLLSFNALMIYFLEPIKSIIDLSPIIKYTSISLRRLFELYDVKGEQLKANNKELTYRMSGNIDITNFNFSYNNRDYILNNINLKIKSKEKVLIVGPSGEGKSTLLKLLMRYYNIDNNKIFIDGIDLNNYSLNYLRHNICYVSQNETLFTNSIYNNINLDREYPYEYFLNICKLTYVDAIYKNNPLTFDMLIEENGFNISGGERQRIILARTLMKDNSIYLFDESFNEMDIELERKIIKNILKLLKDKTILLISHRLVNSDLFDKVIYMNNNTITNIKTNQKVDNHG